MIRELIDDQPKRLQSCVQANVIILSKDRWNIFFEVFFKFLEKFVLIYLVFESE